MNWRERAMVAVMVLTAVAAGLLVSVILLGIALAVTHR